MNPGGAARYNLSCDLLDRHLVEGRGDRTALVFDDPRGLVVAITYRELLARVNRFAHALRAAGVVPGDRVFFRVPNHPAFYAGALACARLGAIFIPSSTLFKDAEVRHRLADSGCVAAITTAGLRGAIDAAAGACPALREVLIVDDEGEPPQRGGESLSRRLAKGSDHFVAADTRDDTPAFIAYSSGTTAAPKGILHLHRYARAYDYLIRDWHRYAAGDVVACPAEIGWMLPVASTFLYALRAGVTVLLARSRNPGFQPLAWLELMARHRVTNLVGTPTVWRMLLTVEEPRRRFDLGALRHGTSAGEPLAAATFDRARAAYGVEALDGLGMSECMVYVHDRAGDVVPGSCGRPGEGVVLDVLDDELRPVGVDEPGVLCVRRDSHAGLMREYWNQPGATAEVFRGDWYWTGDVVRRDAGGFHYFLGRADDVMNCSGYRISPFEVESALQSHDAVLEAAVVERKDPIKGAVVAAFVSLRDGRAGDEALERTLIDHVRARLAPFKAPKSVTFVGALPKTQSGKILRRELRNPGG